MAPYDPSFISHYLVSAAALWVSSGVLGGQLFGFGPKSQNIWYILGLLNIRLLYENCPYYLVLHMQIVLIIQFI